ncbi:zinc-dependent alcohol dehydrogenase family protein [Sphingomonas sp. UYAg733]
MPRPERQQIVVRVAAAAINYRDVEILRGTYHTRFPAGLIPLSDGVGSVVAVGDDVTRVKEGDRVCSTFWQRWAAGDFRAAQASYQLGGPIDGMLSEYALLDEQGAVLAPSDLSDVEAATLPCAAVTAWHALFSLGGLKAGETVLTLGTGGVSLFALQFALAAGARVIVTSSKDRKLERVQALGAHELINYTTTPRWGEEAHRLARGRGVDHVIEVGGGATFAQSLAACGVGAQVNAIGYLGGGGSIDPLEIFRRQITVRGIPVGSRASFEAMSAAISTNAIRPIIDRTYPWTEAASAFDHVSSGDPFGKVVLRFDDAA